MHKRSSQDSGSMTDLIVAPMTSTAVHSCTPPRDSNIESEVGEEGHSVE